MKLVIYTQHKENYADEGSAFPYWKNKGGSVYVVEGLSEVDVERINHNGFPTLTKMIECEDDYFIESIEMWDIVADDKEDICDPWENPIVLFYNKLIGRWSAKRTTENDEYGYMRKEIQRKYETWDYNPTTHEQDNYRSSYVVDGYGVVAHERISEVLETIRLQEQLLA